MLTASGFSSLLTLLACAGAVWLAVSYLRGPHDLRRLFSLRVDPSNADALNWRVTIVLGLFIMCISFDFLLSANSGLWLPGDYRNSEAWTWFNRLMVVVVGPAFIVGGLIEGWRRHRRS